MKLCRALPFGVAAMVLAMSASAWAGGQQPVRPVVAPKEELKNLTLVKSDAGKAVVRFGTGALQLLSVGDRVGRTAAVVRSVEPGRLVLDEIATGADGRPQASQIVWRDGETGGTRFRRQSDQRAPAGVRPRAVDPVAPSDAAKKPGAAQ
jgi:hypothetical protein